MTGELKGIWATGKTGVEELRRTMADLGMELNPANPEIVVVLGGDGSMLRTNRAYPASGMLPVIKDSFGGASAQRLGVNDFDTAINKVRKGAYKLDEVMRVEVQYKDFKTWALNEVVVTQDDEQCNRMRVTSGGKDLYGVELIGNGIIAAAPTGTTGYCHSAGGNVLGQKERKFELVLLLDRYIARDDRKFFVLPTYAQFKGNETENGRRVLTNIRDYKIFNEGEEATVTFNKDVRNKIVPDSLIDERRYFDFKTGDTVTVRAAKENSKFVRIL